LGLRVKVVLHHVIAHAPRGVGVRFAALVSDRRHSTLLGHEVLDQRGAGHRSSNINWQLVFLNVLVHRGAAVLQTRDGLGSAATILQWRQRVSNFPLHELDGLFIAVERGRLIVQFSRHLLLNISFELVGVGVAHLLEFLFVVNAHLVQVKVAVLLRLHVRFVVIVVHQLVDVV